MPVDFFIVLLEMGCVKECSLAPFAGEFVFAVGLCEVNLFQLLFFDALFESKSGNCCVPEQLCLPPYKTRMRAELRPLLCTDQKEHWPVKVSCAEIW